MSSPPEPDAPLAMSISDDEADARMQIDGDGATNAAAAAPAAALATAAPLGDEESSGDEDETAAARPRRASAKFASSSLSAGDYDFDSSSSAASDYDAEEYAAAYGTLSPLELEYQNELESAQACGLPPSFMHALELQCMPEFANYSSLYIELRNTICRQWQKALTAYLTFDDMARRSRLQPRLRACARRVFDFLNLHGFINCGLLPPEADTPQGRPREQLTLQRTTEQHAANILSVRRKSDAATTAASAPLAQDSNGSAPSAPMVKLEENVVMKEEVEPLLPKEATDGTADSVQIVTKDEPFSPSVATPLLALSLNPAEAAAALPSPPHAADALATSCGVAPPPAPAAVAPVPVTTTSPSASFIPQRILVIGAGASGLAAARQLRSFGHTVTVLEGRDRVGGRVNTIRTRFSAPVDLGASIMTGLLGSPLNVLCKQHAQREFGVGFSTSRTIAKSTVEAPACPFPDVMHYIQHGCAIYDSNGALVDSDIDTRAEDIFNKLLEGEYPLKRDAGHECEAPADGKLTKEEMDKIKLPNPKDVYKMDVESGLEVARKALGIRLSPAEQKLFDWHAANLEYGCATALNKLSLVYWDQDDSNAWEGDHALIKPGFGSFIDQLASDLDIRFNQHVQSITYAPEPGTAEAASAPADAAPVVVRVRDRSTDELVSLEGDLVLCTASLGVLKTGALEFSPPLPSWKTGAISGLGFGLLNKLILEFPAPFWKVKNDADMFGYLTPGPRETRGKFYIFWNLERSTGQPILAALCAGEAAFSMEEQSEETLVAECMAALRAIHSEQTVPDPLHTHQTKWSKDEFARGSYSYLAAGNNGKEYDLLAQSVGSTLYFAGEACCRDYPATVPGAYLSGLRAAGQMQSYLCGWDSANAGADVLAELSRHQKTQVLSKPDSLASALKQQAERELHQQGATGENALQLKVAEILARQQRRRRGIRDYAAYHHQHRDDDEAKPQESRENMSARLEAAAQLLKRGMFAPPRESVKNEVMDEPTYAQIKRFEGELENPFAAQQHDTQGLTGLVSFSEFDLSTLGGGGAASSSAGHKSRRSSHAREKDRKSDRRDKRAREHGGSKSHRSSRGDGGDRSSKKHKGSSGGASSASQQAETLIARYVGKVVYACRDSVPPAALAANPKLLKAVQRKGAAKVFEDWSSKPRGDLPMHEWLNDKRKAKIKELVNRYMQLYSHAASGSARPSATDPAQARASPTGSHSSNGAAAAAAAAAPVAVAAPPAAVAPAARSTYVPLPGDPRAAHRHQSQAQPSHSHSGHRYAPVPQQPQTQSRHSSGPSPRFYPSDDRR